MVCGNHRGMGTLIGRRQPWSFFFSFLFFFLVPRQRGTNKNEKEEEIIIQSSGEGQGFVSAQGYPVEEPLIPVRSFAEATPDTCLALAFRRKYLVRRMSADTDLNFSLITPSVGSGTHPREPRFSRTNVGSLVLLSRPHTARDAVEL